MASYSGMMEIQHTGRTPFLGQLPKLPIGSIPRELGGLGDETILDATPAPLAVTDLTGTALVDSRYALMERMRVVRTAVMESVRGTNDRVVLVTSPRPETGKSSQG